VAAGQAVDLQRINVLSVRGSSPVWPIRVERVVRRRRQGWYYALTGLNSYDVLLYTAVTALRTPIADPERVADVAEELVRFRRVPETEHREEWEGAQDVRDAASDFRRSRLGLGPCRRWEDDGSERRPGPVCC
jgi:hypothetical protein